YPIYAYPQDWKGALPSRKQIDGDKALIDKDLELAYADNRIDIYYMQMQGSGIVQYPNGKRELFIYAGNNGHRFRSVNQFLQHSDEHDISNLTSIGIKKYLESNPSIIDSVLYEDKSYVFFERRPFSVPLGASNVPLTSTHSLAVDPKYIPLGSCLLGAVPTQKSGVLKHQLRFLVAQDVGGAIRGAGHVDLYCGMGKEAQEKADRTHHNGKLWIMLLKKDKVDLAQRNLAMR
ncbi:MAG: MltA domain-containing protein, partial [Saprospiraceae bacterium]|nr:MltA domain-containing protein [Saprospiraceae bacterium]